MYFMTFEVPSMPLLVHRSLSGWLAVVLLTNSYDLIYLKPSLLVLEAVEGAYLISDFILY